jgi:anti-anti-sigma regulatory factor
VVDEQARVVIVDIAGVPVVDTRVADHLLKTTEAVHLLGAVTIVTGISAQVARTIVQLGVDISSIHTRARLEDGIELAWVWWARPSRTRSPDGPRPHPHPAHRLDAAGDIQTDLHDAMAEAFQEDVLQAIEKEGAAGLLIDVSGLDTGRQLRGAGARRHRQDGRLMGTETVIVGVRPEVASTLVRMGYSMGKGVRTALNVDDGLALLGTSLTKRR